MNAGQFILFASDPFRGLETPLLVLFTFTASVLFALSLLFRARVRHSDKIVLIAPLIGAVLGACIDTIAIPFFAAIGTILAFIVTWLIQAPIQTIAVVVGLMTGAVGGGMLIGEVGVLLGGLIGGSVGYLAATVALTYEN